MAGNVWEWTATPYCPYRDKRCDASSRVIRGGSWNNGRFNIRAVNRCSWNPAESLFTIGLRCAESA
jgi:formylglycine-generating enzyme required for sulfatase activity